MNKSTKKLLIALTTISITVLIIAFFYYRNINQAADPRIAKARSLFAQYSGLIEEKKYPMVFIVLDELEELYSTTPGYDESFELGIIYNNRTATYLLMALYDDKNDLLVKAEKTALTSITIYEKWLSNYGQLKRDEIKLKLSPYFQISEKVLNKRVDDIELAQLEVKRRLSVSYTNLGIVQRHLLKLEQAVISQSKAIELWPDNHTAKNNLRVLLGEKPVKRSLLQQLFPKQRTKPTDNTKK